jgi:hypothetical protein
MKLGRTFILPILLAGCATAGYFPQSGDPNAAMATARDQIALAEQAGADSLAPEALASAQQNLQTAESHMQGSSKRAAVDAKQAAADAIYAKAQAERVRAEHDQQQAQTALEALPPRGGR